jgi:hypothetical protein
MMTVMLMRNSYDGNEKEEGWQQHDRPVATWQASGNIADRR